MFVYCVVVFLIVVYTFTTSSLANVRNQSIDAQWQLRLLTRRHQTQSKDRGSSGKSQVLEKKLEHAAKLLKRSSEQVKKLKKEAEDSKKKISELQKQKQESMGDSEEEEPDDMSPTP